MGKSDNTKKAIEKPGFTFGWTQEDLPDGLQLMSLLFGTAAIVVKYRWCAWLSLINAVICVANMRTADIDVKNLMSSFGIAVMALVFAYVGPTSNQFV